MFLTGIGDVPEVPFDLQIERQSDYYCHYLIVLYGRDVPRETSAAKCPEMSVKISKFNAWKTFLYVDSGYT
jgi:hypothetical protein